MGEISTAAFVEPPYEYARSHRAAGFTGCRAYNGIKRPEENNPAAPERCRDARLERQAKREMKSVSALIVGVMEAYLAEQREEQ